jgi:[protein-PII] uridylyltransferase
MLFLTKHHPSTSEYPVSEAIPCLSSWQERCDWFRRRIEQRIPAGISAEEIESHFSAMPPYYWDSVTETDLLWGLETIHGFLKVIASPHLSSTTPFVSWRQFQQNHCTRVMLCTWDRQGLLAKAAAAFSAVKFNVLQADIFTRSDNIVLDQFSISDSNGRNSVDETRMQEMAFLLEGALSDPPRFASVWACSRHKYLAAPGGSAPRIGCDNATSPNSTIVHVEAADRLGLLYDILQAISDQGLNIRQARVSTENHLARDTFHVADSEGNKLSANGQLGSLLAALKSALTVAE